MLRTVVSRILFILTTFCWCDQPTFQNVTILGYNLYVQKFNKTITTSENLIDNIPSKPHVDAVVIEDQYVPILKESSLANLDDLDELIIKQCAVKEIQSKSLWNVPGLRKFSLEGNRLEHIKGGVFTNLSISTLDLSRNAIKSIDKDAFDNMPNLLNIKLSDNNISKWDADWFKNTPLLSRISMQNNQLVVIPALAFKNLGGVKKYGSIDLTVNLIFSHNHILNVHPEAFTAIERINNLWLDHNRLTEFEDMLLEDTQVNELRLDGNRFQCLDGDFGKILGAANTTYLDSNPFDCKCLAKIKSWMKQSDKNVIIFYADLECTMQRIRNKMKLLEDRLKEVKNM